MVISSTTQKAHNMTDITNDNQLTNALMDALHACNLAGTFTYDRPSWETIKANEINPEFHTNVHDILCDALRIVNPELLEAYIETGDRQYAEDK
jgi:hypothetical protein